ncbi:MAG: hypothetical protein ACR2KG_04000 [Nocardioidaceae bacterium]
MAPPARRPRPPRCHRFSLTIATIAIVLGIIWVLDKSTRLDGAPSVYPGTALGIVALSLLFGT